MTLTIDQLYVILATLKQQGHGHGVITVYTDDGLTDQPSVVWHERWGHDGQLEINKGAVAIRGVMLHDGYAS